MDASGRMSVSELTASLEGAVLAEERTPSGVCVCVCVCACVCVCMCMCMCVCILASTRVCVLSKLRRILHGTIPSKNT